MRPLPVEPAEDMEPPTTGKGELIRMIPSTSDNRPGDLLRKDAETLKRSKKYDEDALTRKLLSRYVVPASAIDWGIDSL